MSASYFKIGQLIRNKPAILMDERTRARARSRAYLIVGIKNSVLGGRIIPDYFRYSALDGDKIINLDMDNKIASKFYEVLSDV